MVLEAGLAVKVKVTQFCPTLCNPMDYTVHGILQARTQEWVTFPFSRGSSQLRDQTQVSHITGRFLTSWATREVLPRGLERQELVDLKFWRLRRSQWRNGSFKLKETEIQRMNFSLSVTRVLGYRSNCLLVILKSPNLWKQKASPFSPKFLAQKLSEWWSLTCVNKK